MPALLIIAPIVAVLTLNLPLGRIARKAALWLAMLVCLGQGALVLASPPEFWGVSIRYLARLFPDGFILDDLAMVMFLTIAVVGLTSLMTARYAVKSEGRRFTFICLLLLAMAGMNGVVLANDLFSLYVFLEAAAVASFVLIAFDRERDAYEGAFKYIVLSAVATAMILTGVGLLFMVAGGVSFKDTAFAVASAPHSRFAILAVVIFIAGLSIKSGLVPFHGWLPDAYTAAPAPVSVLLAGVITKTVGVYTLMRLTTAVFGFSTHVKWILMVAGIVSIIFGALAAIGQRDFKRMLAYSSISQVGYIILGLGTGTTLGFAGAVFHLFNHAIFKSLLFVNAAAVEGQAGTRDLDSLGGIAARMPVTGVTSAIAALSTSGIPPLAGFWSKLIVILAVWQAGHHGIAAAAILASLITLAYFLQLQRKVFFGKLIKEFENLREAGGWLLVPSVLLAAATVGLGFAIPWLFETFLVPHRSILL